jgi:hypothetical protein
LILEKRQHIKLVRRVENREVEVEEIKEILNEDMDGMYN